MQSSRSHQRELLFVVTIATVVYNGYTNLISIEREGCMESVIGWIVLGGLAGWIASKFVGTDEQQGFVGNIVAGVLGGVVGGWVFSLLGGAGVTGLNVWSLLVAVIGAMIVIFAWKVISGKK